MDIIRKRTVRFSGKMGDAKSFRVDTQKVKENDLLTIYIYPVGTLITRGIQYHFDGDDLVDKDSISFRIKDLRNSLNVKWNGAKPTGIGKFCKKRKERLTLNFITKLKQNNGHYFCLPPIVNEYSKVLIISTIPNKESLIKQEYYSEENNLFWRMLSDLTEQNFFHDYQGKIKELAKNSIALWDVCQSCLRKDDSDDTVTEVIPNNLTGFLENYPKIKAIAFNGEKAKELFDMYFGTLQGYELFVLSSTNPMNSGPQKDYQNTGWRDLWRYYNSLR